MAKSWIFHAKKNDFLVILISCDNIILYSCSCIIWFIKLVVKSDKMLGKPRI